MRKVRRTLPIILTASVVLGLLAVAGHAKKPAPPAEPAIQVVGGIMVLPNGTTTDPANVRVQFLDSSFRDDPLTALWAGLSFPANADRSPALYTIHQSAGTVDRRLKFYSALIRAIRGKRAKMTFDVRTLKDIAPTIML